MKIDRKESHTIITSSENSFTEFYDNFLKEKESIANEHVILNFSESFNTGIQEILLFLNFANNYRKNGTSFVIISSGMNIDEIPDEINVVPTMIEAIDVLELDAIERDLMNF